MIKLQNGTIINSAKQANKYIIVYEILDVEHPTSPKPVLNYSFNATSKSPPKEISDSKRFWHLMLTAAWRSTPAIRRGHPAPKSCRQSVRACNVVVNVANEWFQSLPRHQPSLPTEQTTARDMGSIDRQQVFKVGVRGLFIIPLKPFAVGSISHDSRFRHIQKIILGIITNMVLIF
jgi:hypothetical protein